MSDDRVVNAIERWAEDLERWAIPAHIRSQAPASPYTHRTASFAVDDTLDRTVISAEVARALLPVEGGSVLDIGCGGGRAAMSVVPPANRVVGVDESADMLAEFTRAAGAAGVRSATVQGRWPDVADEVTVADLVVCHHVAYNVADIEPFVSALTRRARLGVVMVLPIAHPQSGWNPAWKHFWDLDRPTSPSSDDFAAVLAEMGLDAERWEMPAPPMAEAASDPSTRVTNALRRLCLSDDRADEMAAFLDSTEHPWVATHSVFRWPGDPD